MSNHRSWTWIDEDISEELIELRTPAVGDLAARWNQMHNAAEQEGWRRQAAYENPCEDDSPEFETEAEMKAFELRRQVSDRLKAAQMEEVERQLHELGARMMRPYEHWNEDEQLMAHLEGY